MKNNKRIAAGVLSLAMLAGIAAGCTKYESGTEKVYSYDEAIKELNAFNDKISTNEVKPQLDIYNTDTSASVKVLCLTSLICFSLLMILMQNIISAGLIIAWPLPVRL